MNPSARVGHLVAANLLVAFAHQASILYLLGGSGADVLFSAQAPSMVVAAVAASIASNVVVPRLKSGLANDQGSVDLGSVLRPFGAAAAIAAVLTWAFFALTSKHLFADRISYHPDFLGAMALCSFSSFCTAVMSLYLAHLAVANDLRRAELSQLCFGVLGLACNVVLTSQWGVVGAAVALTIKPALCTLSFAIAARPLVALPEGHDSRREARRLLRSATKLVPSHLLQKMTPLLDRTFLGYADPSTLTAYALATQVIGAALTYADRTVTRASLVKLGRLPMPMRLLSVSALWRGLSPFVVGSIAVGLVWAVTRLSSDSVIDPTLASYLPMADAMLAFSLAAVCVGAAAQLSATPLYAASKLSVIARLSTLAITVSVGLRGLLFVAFGLGGFFMGVLAHHVISTWLFLRAGRADRGQ